VNTKFLLEELKERNHSEDLGVDGMIPLKWSLNTVDWIDLAEDRVQQRAVVNTVMNLRVPYKTKNFLTSSANISVSRNTLLHVGISSRTTTDALGTRNSGNTSQ
jgi:hypothetical protein